MSIDINIANNLLSHISVLDEFRIVEQRRDYYDRIIPLFENFLKNPSDIPSHNFPLDINLFYTSLGRQYEIKTTIDLFALIYYKFFEIKLDSWDIDEAYKLLEIILLNNYHQSSLAKELGFYYSLITNASSLCKRLFVANKMSESQECYKLIKPIFKKLKAEGLFFENEENLIIEVMEGRRKYRVLITHKLQAKKLLALNLITEEKYNDYIVKVSNIEKERVDLCNKSVYKGEIPKWDEYFSTLEVASAEQKEFLYYWVSQIKKKNFIDLKNNYSYFYAHLDSLIKDFLKSKNITSLTNEIKYISSLYGFDKKIMWSVTNTLSSAYLHLEDYDKCWEIQKENWKYGEKNIEIGAFLTIRSKCSNTFIDGKDLLRMLGTNDGITHFGKKNIDSIIELATLFLHDFQKLNGMNFVEFFVRQFNLKVLNSYDYEKLKQYFPNEKDYYFWYDIEEKGYSERSGHKISEEIKRWSETREKNNQIHYKQPLFVHCFAENAPTTTTIILPNIVLVALQNEAKRILREAENTAREEINLPKVGEGWISETELFYKLLKEFPNHKIIHHGRPEWLNRQHLDIYFPEKNIALEYQGLQHIQPVEYFGGLETFNTQKERDERKKKLCKTNNCRLIYVYENYDFISIVNQIKEFVSY